MKVAVNPVEGYKLYLSSVGLEGSRLEMDILSLLHLNSDFHWDRNTFTQSILMTTRVRRFICEKLDINPSTLTEYILRLKEKGYLEKENSMIYLDSSKSYREYINHYQISGGKCVVEVSFSVVSR